MKICVYGVSDKERPCFEEAGREMGLQVELHREDPSLASAHLAQGCTCVSILSIPAPAATARAAASAKPLGALSPVPTAVPPRASSKSPGRLAPSSSRHRSRLARQPLISWPRVMGTAS